MERPVEPASPRTALCEDPHCVGVGLYAEQADEMGRSIYQQQARKMSVALKSLSVWEQSQYGSPLCRAKCTGQYIYNELMSSLT